MLEAGRPDAEARAAGAITQAHYEARAARFEGKLGSGRDLYEAEAPDIKKGAAGKAPGSFTISENVIRLFSKADASTIIHELGHNWLEELLRDAKHPDAPPDY
jgi:hypothetical protein